MCSKFVVSVFVHCTMYMFVCSSEFFCYVIYAAYVLSSHWDWKTFKPGAIVDHGSLAVENPWWISEV